MWNAGKSLEDTNDGTHQVITRDALNVIVPLFPDFFLKNSKGNFITQTYSDYPDMKETTHFNSWHFYNYQSKGNYWGNILDNHTAKSKFIEHYNKAREYYSTNPIEAFRELGAAMHYISDIATPVHVGDGIFPNSEWATLLILLGPGTVLALYLVDTVTKHTNFENYVNDRDENAVCAIPTNINYEYYVNVELDTLVEITAASSYYFYSQAQGNDSQKYQAMINTLPKAKEIVAGLLYRFALEKSGQHVHNYIFEWNGNHYHSGDQHYYQYNYKCNTCGYILYTEWRNNFCPGPPCMTPWSYDT